MALIALPCCAACRTLWPCPSRWPRMTTRIRTRSSLTGASPWMPWAGRPTARPRTARWASLRSAPSVQHFTKTLDRVEGVDFRLPTNAELDALEAFQRSLGRQEEVDLAALTFLDDAAQRGKDLFEGVGVNRACTACHANAGANVVDDENPDEGFNDSFDTGTRGLGSWPCRRRFRPGSPGWRGRLWQWDDEYATVDRSR